MHCEVVMTWLSRCVSVFSACHGRTVVLCVLSVVVVVVVVAL